MHSLTQKGKLIGSRGSSTTTSISHQIPKLLCLILLVLDGLLF